ncbi:transporter [Lithospermum erythrorhizon]|uniref:Transporter n=1 Tax=Lithospermum erythrorhizon TaxID=34254 RepID=A0AAV3RXF3_LITER
MTSQEEEKSLLEDGLISQIKRNELYTGDGSVDIKGNPVLKTETGNWRACPFILGTECCERLAYYGIALNLVSYLTKELHEGNVSAARNVTTWQGTSNLSTLIGAVLADSYWGKYWTIAAFSTFYFFGMFTLTLSASVPTFMPAECATSVCPSATSAQFAIFSLGLYLVALGTGGINPCVSSFGADQFDDSDHDERVKKGSFFNWFYFCINIGAFVSSSLLVWIQENIGWGVGFGIPTLIMGIAISSFFLGTPLYRFQKPGGSPLTRMCQRSSLRKLVHTNELKCLDRAAVISNAERKSGDYSDTWKLCTVTQVEELKILLRMFPIWATGIINSVVHCQISTVLIEQGTMMDKSIGSFNIPTASLITFNCITVILWIPFYDRVLVPIARNLTDQETGFSQLQRIGIGLFISTISMCAADLVEIKRLQLARELGLVHKAVTVPLSIFWQIPQFALLGVAEVFTSIGLLEFFYDQSPDAMRSLSSVLNLIIVAFGNFSSSIILTIVTTITTRGGNAGWIPDNLNQGHLDYFFWLLAGLSLVNLLIYVVCAKHYKLKKAFVSVS